jgi:hypothetical protein
MIVLLLSSHPAIKNSNKTCQRLSHIPIPKVKMNVAYQCLIERETTTASRLKAQFSLFK